MLWTIEDAAEALQVSGTTIRRLVGSRKIPFVRVGSAIRFPPEALKAWVAENTQLPYDASKKEEKTWLSEEMATGSTSGGTEEKNPSIGGLASRMRAAKELGNLLELPITKRPKRS